MLLCLPLPFDDLIWRSMQYLAHSSYFQSGDETAPLKLKIRHLGLLTGKPVRLVFALVFFVAVRPG
jgi:hypothetical protein